MMTAKVHSLYGARKRFDKLLIKARNEDLNANTNALSLLSIPIIRAPIVINGIDPP